MSLWQAFLLHDKITAKGSDERRRSSLHECHRRSLLRSPPRGENTLWCERYVLSGRFGLYLPGWPRRTRISRKGKDRKNMVIGILAHVDAGKTTLSEAILYHTKSIRTMGRVDHRDAFLDTHSIEKERGITIFSNQAVFPLGKNQCFLLDTPGHADFSSEMERAVSVMDYAIMVVSAVEGIQGHTETVWRILRRYKVPTFFFLNKTDRDGADAAGVMQALTKQFSEGCVLFSGRFPEEIYSEELAETLAGLDETLLEEYAAGHIGSPEWAERIRQLIVSEVVFPCFSGSALQDEGVAEFLAALPYLTKQEADSTRPFSGRVYQLRRDAQGNRLAFVKVLSGILQVKDEVLCPGEGEPELRKVNELRLYSGAKFAPEQKMAAGGLCAVTGLDGVRPGDIIGVGCKNEAEMETVPALVSKVCFDGAVPARTVLGYFKILEEEDPLLGVEWDEALQELHVHVMGTVQLEVLREVVRQRFGLEVAFGECEVLYRETVAAPVVGYGHYEPLRHYAEVHLRISPGERGSGITFSSECPTDVLEERYQNLVRTHVFEKEHRGVLTGAPLADVHIALVTGRAHLKHTEGGDFREAVYRAVRQGLCRAESILLEPYYRFTASAPAECVGRILSDVQRLGGSFEPPQTDGSRATVRGRGPASAFMGYAREFVSFTKGKGSLSMMVDGYEPCKDAEKVIEKRGYDKERDVANTPDSVFCSHGAGFPVKWNEVERYIHCK